MKNFRKQLEILRDHNPGINLHICCTGAGAGLQKAIWDLPGASNFLVGAVFPYATRDMDDFLGFKTDIGYCNQEMAMNIALESYARALKSGNVKDGKLNVGLGLTACVTSTQEHRGEHRAHVAVVTDTESLIYNVVLNKNCGSREQDGFLCDLVGLCALFQATIKDTQYHTDLLQKLRVATKSIEVIDNEESNKIMSKCFWKRPFFDKNNKRHLKNTDNDKTAYLAGSFNPPHEAHFGMANEYINMTTGGNVVYTISADHPEKGNLHIQELLWRSKLLSGYGRIFALGEPLFLDKIRNHANRTFIMGSDTLLRLLDPKWGPSTAEVLAGFVEANTKLYVSIRTDSDVQELDLVDGLIYTKLNGKWDISSTKIRENEK